jgi:hypothetical protein
MLTSAPEARQPVPPEVEWEAPVAEREWWRGTRQRRFRRQQRRRGGISGTFGAGTGAGGSGGTLDAGTGGAGGSSGTFGDPPDAADARNDTDVDGPSCSCTKSPLYPDSPDVPFYVGLLHWSCYCQLYSCLRYDENRSPDGCAGFSEVWVSTFSNCNFVEVEIWTGLWGKVVPVRRNDARTGRRPNLRRRSDIRGQDERVHAIGAGTQPPPTCTLLERVYLCE